MIDPIGRAMNSSMASIDGNMKVMNVLCGTWAGSSPAMVDKGAGFPRPPLCCQFRKPACWAEAL